MNIALAQLNPTIGDLDGNAAQLLAAAEAAADQGASLLLTPELSLCGYPPRDLLLQGQFVARLEQVLHQLALDLPPQLQALIGTVVANPEAHRQGQKPLFNAMALVSEGQVQQIFHKRLLPTYDVFDEDRYFESGQESNSFVIPIAAAPTLTPARVGPAVGSAIGSAVSAAAGAAVGSIWGSGSAPDEALPPATRDIAVGEGGRDRPSPSLRIGVTICEDLWNDEDFWGRRSYEANPIADLATQNVDLIVNLSASPYSMGKQALRERMLGHIAQRYRQPILYVNQVGGNDDLVFDGGSFGVNRSGEVVVRSESFATGLLVAEFHPILRDLQPGPLAEAPSEEASLWAALVLGVRDYGMKCGFSQAVLGLSGGIDSALVAAIAAAALGPENVLGILMPSPYSSDHSLSDALDLAQTIGIRTETLPIQPAMAAFDDTLAGLFEGTEFGVTEENIQSRIRGTLLMAIANKFGYLLISTGNKSEMAVGYCTLYGDMNGGLAAISDLPKTKVFSLCHWLNQQGGAVFGLTVSGDEIIPGNIITKPPSAELKPGQLDQDSLPPYDILDDILDRIVCQHQSRSEIIAAGHEAAIVERVMGLVNRAEFKRKQAAPGLKVTDRAFGTGWRMPIAKRWRA